MIWIIAIVVVASIAYFASRNGDGAGAAPSEPATDRKAAMTGVRLLPIGRTPVVGEYYRQKEIKTIIRGRAREIAPVGSWDNTLILTALLMREPGNRYDRNAIAVKMGGITVGYLAKETTGMWQPLLKRLESSDEYPECDAAIYRDGHGIYQIILHCSASTPFAINRQPDGRIPLAPDRQVAIIGEELHQDELKPYDCDSYVWATLDKDEIPKGKYKGQPTYWASLDGNRIGYITSVQYARYEPLLSAMPECCCVAFVSQGTKKLELSIMLPKQ